MASLRRANGAISLTLDEREHTALLAIIHHLARKLNASWTLPTRAYDDDELQGDYASWVAPALVAEQEAEIQEMLGIFSPLQPAYLLSESQAFAFARLLNALQHVAASELGITADDWAETAGPELRGRPEYKMLMTLLLLEGDLIGALTTW